MKPPRKLILRNMQSPGDIVMLTAAVRDLHLAHPKTFLTDVRTSCPELWEHSPWITAFDDDDPEVERIDCAYPLIQSANHTPYHFIHGFRKNLAEKLGVRIPATSFSGDIHLTKEERGWNSQVTELTGDDVPFWIINAGGKYDFTIKRWDETRFQRVVDYFAGRICFVQIGENHHIHPPLRGVIDFRGKTDLRQLVRLVYHAEGVICGVTGLMHLAAAVPVRHGGARAGVVIAGGREPVHWEAYPTHRFLHTIGALPCCEIGGCWKSRTYALNDGDMQDTNLCETPVSLDPSQPPAPGQRNGIVATEAQNGATALRRIFAKCMHMIEVEDVIRAVQTYYHGGTHAYLSKEQWSRVSATINAVPVR